MRDRPTNLWHMLGVALAGSVAVLAGPSLGAQTPQKLDFMGFTLPAGEWKQASAKDHESYTRTVPGRGFCRLTVFRASPSRGTLDADAAADWDALILKRYPGATNRKTRTVPISGTAWTFTQQTAVAKVDGTEMLLSVHTFTGHGHYMSVLFENTHQPFDDLLNQFIGGLSMSASIASAPTRAAVATTAPNPTGQTRSILGKWQRTAASFTDWRAGSTQGFIRWLYDFKADGSYTFISKSWPMNGDRMYYRRESGAYRLDGESLTLTPKRSASECWTKQPAHNNDPDKLVSTQSSPMEVTRYRLAWHFWTGIKEWNLVLMADQQTVRDGPFSANTTFSNAWFYKSVGPDATAE